MALQIKGKRTSAKSKGQEKKTEAAVRRILKARKGSAAKKSAAKRKK